MNKEFLEMTIRDLAQLEQMIRDARFRAEEMLLKRTLGKNSTGYSPVDPDDGRE